MSWSDTWQLWVDFLSHVLHQVSGHLSSDVHQNSSFIGGDLIDQHRTGVSKNQLCVVGFELGTVLREQNTTLRLSRLSKDVAFCLTIQIYKCQLYLHYASNKMRRHFSFSRDQIFTELGEAAVSHYGQRSIYLLKDSTTNL